MNELLKRYMPTFGALLATHQHVPALGWTRDYRTSKTQVCREEIVELFKDKLR